MISEPQSYVVGAAIDGSTDNLAAHRVQILGAILPAAVAYGVTEVEPTREPLRVCLPSNRCTYTAI
jgi:hypothetical protein